MQPRIEIVKREVNPTGEIDQPLVKVISLCVLGELRVPQRAASVPQVNVERCHNIIEMLLCFSVHAGRVAESTLCVK
jgi:hypothetical protein